MSRPLVITLVVAFVVGGLLGFLAAAADIDAGWTPAMVGMFAGVFAGYIAFNLQGTRKSIAASRADAEAWLALSPPQGGRSALYLVRSGFVGKAAGMDFAVDGRPVAQLKAPQFTRIELEPGTRIVSASLTGGARAQSTASEMSLALASGEIAVVHATLSMGMLKNQIGLRRLDGETARATLRGAKAVQPATD